MEHNFFNIDYSNRTDFFCDEQFIVYGYQSFINIYVGSGFRVEDFTKISSNNSCYKGKWEFNFCIHLYFPKPLRKSCKPSAPILPMRTRFAGPHGKSFLSSFARPPRCRAKEQAVKKPLALSSPYPQKA